MPAKNVNSKQSQPVVATTVKTTTSQKGGKKVEATPVVETTIVVETSPVVETTPTKTQKGGKKVVAKATPVEVAPVETETVVEATPTKTQKGGKKVAAKVAPVEVAPVETVTVVEATPTQKGGKKVVATTKKVVAKKATDKETDEVEETIDRKIRSFKVKLPNSEEFEGRFTGLTPYQAANKALSKYFRETEKPQVEITFSICESTRKSRKATYTYVGQRQKLEIPVTYKILDGREIVKNFKNTLKKVKKSDTANASV